MLSLHARQGFCFSMTRLYSIGASEQQYIYASRRRAKRGRRAMCLVSKQPSDMAYIEPPHANHKHTTTLGGVVKRLVSCVASMRRSSLLTQRDLRDYDEPCNMLRPKCFSVRTCVHVRLDARAHLYATRRGRRVGASVRYVLRFRSRGWTCTSNA